MNIYRIENPHFSTTDVMANDLTNALDKYSKIVENEIIEGCLIDVASVDDVVKNITKCECVKTNVADKTSILEELKGLICKNDGYLLIPKGKRLAVSLSNGCGKTQVRKIKSLVSVCESIDYDNIHIKAIDEDDVMWDLGEYLGDIQLSLFYNNLISFTTI